MVIEGAEQRAKYARALLLYSEASPITPNDPSPQRRHQTIYALLALLDGKEELNRIPHDLKNR
jgi:hypothetical protein